MQTFQDGQILYASELNQFTADMVVARDAAAASATAASGSATTASQQASTATTKALDSANSATSAANSATTAQAAAASAVATVTGGTASLTPAGGKIPLADAKGKINGGWLDTLAAVYAVLPPLSFVDSCLSLARDDSDGGLWRKQFAGKSWGQETRTTGRYLGSYANGVAAVNAQLGSVGDYYYDTTSGAFEAITSITGTPPSATATVEAATYRAGTQEFPADALFTAEGLRVIIWDISHGSPTMWAVTTNAAYGWVPNTISSIAASGPTIVIGTAVSGMVVWNMQSGTAFNRGLGTTCQTWSSRNSAWGNYASGLPSIVSSAVNGVAITVLPDAPLDEFGMPVPTIYAATAGGLSVVTHDGNVLNSAVTYNFNNCSVDSNGNIFATIFDTSQSTEVFSKPSATAFTGTLLSSASIPAMLAGAAGSAPKIIPFAKAGYGGLTLTKWNPSALTKSLVAYITNTYNTGWMVGDIRACFYANSLTADRSVKGLTLTTVGTVTETVNAGGRNVYSGYSAANYSQIASNPAFNALGTGDFSILMSAVKWGTAGTLKTLLSIGDGASAGSIEVQQLAANTLALLIHNGTSLTAIATSTATFTDAAEHTIDVKRGTFGGVANTVQILVDGVVVASAVSALTISNATGFLRIGEAQAASRPWAGGQVACVRISATAPTAEQSAYIAATENALNGGALCLLSNSASVSALAYDKGRDLLYVGNGTNVDGFSGLKLVSSAAHGVTTLKALAARHGNLSIVGTGGSFASEERNIQGELNNMRQAVAARNQATLPKSVTSDAASVLKFPQGFKPTRVFSQAGAYVSLTANAPKFDGFVWYLDSGVGASTAYDCELVRAE